MGKFEQDARKLLQAVGGKGNIAAVSHCATRMRFVLNDAAKADVSAIEQLPSVKGTFTNAGQFQVIIGNDVPIFYNDFTAVSGIEGVSKEQVKAAGAKNQNKLQQAVAFLAEIFTPIIPAIIVGGLILGFRNILEGVGFEFLGQQVVDGVKQFWPDGSAKYNTITMVSPFWNGVNHFLWLPGEAIFHFLPVGITWSVTKKLGTSQILGIVLGICLVSPQLLNAYEVAGTPAAEIAEKWTWNFGEFTINRIGYQAQVIPALLSGLALAHLEIFWRKRVPEVVSMILVPFLSLLPALILAHTVLGPLGWTIGKGISTVVLAGLTGSLRWLFGAIFGALYAPLVITGLHHMSNAIDTQLIADAGGTMLWPMIALSNIAQASSVFAYYWMNRQNEKEGQLSMSAAISAYLGVTEPALFGVNLKYIYPFVAGIIGSGIAGLLSTTFGVTANAIGVGGLPGFLAIQGQSMALFFVCMAVAIIVPFILTLFFRKANILTKAEDQVNESKNISREETASHSINAVTSSMELLSPLTGKVLDLSESSDPAFAKGVMGQGVLIYPSAGEVHSPVDGTISVLFPSKHAIGITTATGVDILIHVGVDTVHLDGKGFETFVSQGDTVSAGELLLRFDAELIKEAGFSTETPILITNHETYHPAISFSLPTEIAAKELLFTVTKQ